MDIVPPAGVRRVPRGFADLAGVAGFVCAADGIERLDLLTGRRVWSTGLARYPVGLWRAQLIALRGSIRDGLSVATLDAERPAAALISSAPVPIPPWAGAGPDGLHLDTSIENEDLILAWEARKGYEGGAPPPPGIERAATRSTAGAARVSLITGEVKAAAPRRLQPASVEFTQSRGAEWHSDPWPSGGSLVRTVLAEVDGRQRLSLQFGSGDAAERMLLQEGTALVATATLDGDHIVVRDDAGAGEDRNANIFSIPARRRVATITWEADASDPSVLGDRVLYLVRHVERAATPHSRGAVVLALRSRGLEDDRVAWEHPLDRLQTGPRQVRP
jgi:hypothetical protein